MQNTITEQNPILWCMNADNMLGTLKGRYSNSVQTRELDKFSVATPLFIPITTKIRKSLSSILRNEGRYRLLTYVIQSLRCMDAERFYPAFSERNSSQLQQGIHYKYIRRAEGKRKKKKSNWMNATIPTLHDEYKIRVCPFVSKASFWIMKFLVQLV